MLINAVAFTSTSLVHPHVGGRHSNTQLLVNWAAPAVNETVPDSSSVGRTTADITGKAEQEQTNAGFIVGRGGENVPVHDTIGAGGAPCAHLSCKERAFD